MLRTYELGDELAWVRTGAMMALHANINRGKNTRPYEWSDFSPYAVQKKRAAPPPTITPQLEGLFSKMGKTMKNGK